MKIQIQLSLILAAVLAMPAALLAQNDDGGRNSEVRPRDGEGRRGGRRGFQRGIDAMYERITKDLALDEAQQAELEEIRAGQRERWEAFRQKRDAIRKAEADGDETTAQQLRDEMSAARDEGMRRGGPFAEVIESINGILTPEQQQQFVALQTQMRTEREAQMRDRFNERYDRMAEELQLDEDQRAVLEDVKASQVERMEAMRDRWQQVREAYDSGNEELGDQLRDAMREEMRGSGGPRGFMDEAMTELDPVLTEDQRALAADMRERREERWQNRGQRRRAQLEGEPAADGDAETQDDLTTALNLDANQKAAYAELMNANKQQTAELDAEIASVNGQIKLAQEAGNASQVEKLSQQLNGLTALREAQNEQFHDQVDSLLNAEQKIAYAEIRADAQVADDLKEISADLRTVLRAAMRLKLDRAQKTQIRDMAKEARTLYRTARETDRKNRDRDRSAEKALADQMKNRIVVLLNEEQLDKYIESLERMAPKRKSGRRF